MIQELLDLAWVDVLTTADNHILDTTGNAVESLLVLHAQVARVQIAVLVYHLGRGCGVLVVTLHHVESLAAHLALHAYGALLARLGVEHLHVYKRIVATHGLASLLEGVVQAGLRHTRRTLGESIHAGDGHIHLLAHLLHQLYRAQTSGHDTRTQTGQVEHIEHRVVQLGYKHRGHTIEGCTALFGHRCQHHQRVEFLDHHLGTSVCQAVHSGQHHAEAVEQRHAHAELVVLCKSHVLACKVSVVGYTVVSQHHALGESGCSAGVLHVAHVVAGHLGLHLVQGVVFHVLSQQQQLGGVKHAAILLHTYIYHVLKVWKLLRVQVSALAGLQLGQHGVGHVYVVTVPCAVGDTQRVHIRVFTQILQLVLLVVGVHRYQHGANLSCSVEECEPVGHVGGPYTHVRSLLHANRYQAFGQIIHALVEFAPRKAQVAVAIYYIFLIGSSLSPVLQPLSQCAFVQLVTLASGLSRISSIRQRSPRHIKSYVAHNFLEWNINNC